MVDLVRERAVDLGVAEISTLGTEQDLEAEPIAQHDMVFFCRRGHPLLARPTVSKADLDAFPLASIRVPPRGVGLVPGRGELDADTGDLIPQVEVYEFTTARALILVSDAFGIAAPLQIEPWLRSGELVVLPYRPSWLKLDYGFIHLKNRTLAPAARRFMAIVREIEAELDVRNRSMIRQIFADSEGASGEAG